MASATKERNFKFYFIFIQFILLLEFIYLWLHWSSLHWLSLVAVLGQSPVAVHGFLTVRNPVFAEHGLQACGLRALAAYGLSTCVSGPECRLSSCGAGAQLLWGTWDLPGSVIERALLHWHMILHY